MTAPSTRMPSAPATTRPGTTGRLTPEALRRLALDLGADDAGLVSLDRPELDDQREIIRAQFPWARSLLSLVFRTSTGPLRSPARSLANREFHHTNEQADTVALELVDALERCGHRAGMAPTGFPMEMEHFPGRIWVIAHKPVAEAAGLGVTGKSRMVLHPRLGAFVLLGTVVTDLELAPADEGRPLTDSPCSTCNLCVAACPTGALRQDGGFDFGACYTHNYREFMGGYVDYMDSVADAGSGQALREHVRDDETVSMWQSLSYGPNYKAAYCMAVCPAGDDVIGPFLDSRKDFVKGVVKPLQKKEETVYVVAGSDAERHVTKRYAHKSAKQVRNGLRVKDVRGFLSGMSLTFQRHVAGDLDATFHFVFSGDDESQATVRIVDETITVIEGLVGEPDVRVDADAASWVRYLRKEAGIVWPVISRKIKVKGPLKLLRRFETCFPS